jgi:hypothetical protein
MAHIVGVRLGIRGRGRRVGPLEMGKVWREAPFIGHQPTGEVCSWEYAVDHEVSRVEGVGDAVSRFRGRGGTIWTRSIVPWLQTGHRLSWLPVRRS